MAQEHAERCNELDVASQDKHVPRLHAAISAWSFHPEDDMYKTCRQHLANVWEEYKRSAARLKELSRICASDLENVSEGVEDELVGLLESWPFSEDDRVYDRAYRIIMRLRGEEPEDEEVEGYVYSNFYSNFGLTFGKIWANFERLVLGCIETEFSK